jgi:hypothetical protein
MQSKDFGRTEALNDLHDLNDFNRFKTDFMTKVK